MEIFSLLPPADLKTAVLVCKQWMVVGETPQLWSWVVVNVKTKEDLLKLSKKRTQKLKKVKVTNWVEESQSSLIKSTAVNPKELFNALLPITTLTSIEGLKVVSTNSDLGFIDLDEEIDAPDHPDLTSIEPELFARVLSRLTCLSFSESHPTPPQFEALFSSIAEKDSHVKKLELGPWESGFPQVDVFAAAVGNVEECVGINFVPFQHTEALLVALAEDQGQQLKKLSLLSVTFGTIDPAILGTAISRLEYASIHQAKYMRLMSKEQISAILSKAGEDGSKLKKLEISGLNEEQKGEIDQDVLRQAGQRIGDVQWRTVYLAEDSLTICARA